MLDSCLARHFRLCDRGPVLPSEQTRGFPCVLTLRGAERACSVSQPGLVPAEPSCGFTGSRVPATPASFVPGVTPAFSLGGSVRGLVTGGEFLARDADVRPTCTLCSCRGSTHGQACVLLTAGGRALHLCPALLSWPAAPQQKTSTGRQRPLGTGSSGVGAGIVTG